jgi:hypothetical protein
MPTLAQLKARIANDLTRDDLTDQIANVIPDAIAAYANERFWFNVSRNFTFATVAGQAAYGAADLATIADFIRIDAIFLPQNQSIYPLDRFEPADFEVIAGGMSGGGRPTAFTYIDQQIRLWPTPTAIYPLRVHAHYRLPALSTDGDSNAWVTDAERLIRTHARMLLYLNVLEDIDGATRMQAQIPGLLADLRQETSARMSNGTIQGSGW